MALLLAVDLYATGLFGGSERALALARTVVLPGLPFLEWHVLLGLVAMGSAMGAIGAWLRWGLDWLVLLVMAICLVLAAFVMPLHHHPAPAHPVARASHEFTAVLAVFALIGQLRLLLARLPGSDWIKARLPDGLLFPAVDTARAAGIAAITGSVLVRPSLDDERLRRRAARIDLWARCRRRRAALEGAHAPLRAALSLSGSMGSGPERAIPRGIPLAVGRCSRQRAHLDSSPGRDAGGAGLAAPGRA